MPAASAAQAQDNESGFYAGGGFGQFDVKIDDFDDVDDTIDGYDSDDTAWKAVRRLAHEPLSRVRGGVRQLGSPDDEILPETDLTVETDGFAPYVVGTFPIGDWFEVFAKAGYYWYSTDCSSSRRLAASAMTRATARSPGARVSA